MTLKEKAVIIKEHPLFKGLDYNAINFIAELAQEKKYEPHSFIVRQGDEANAVYLIYKGLVKVYLLSGEGKQIPVKVSGENDYVGDLGVVDGGPIPATVETVHETYTLILTKENFKLLMNTYSHFTINLLETWAKKVRVINKQRENNFSLQLKERTLYALQILSTHFPNNEISLAQEELALIVGASRARVTEVLNELEKQKLIALSNRKIKFL